MRRAIVLGGTGAIGHAVAQTLLDRGWRVDVTGRDPGHMPPDLPGATFRAVGRDDTAAFAALLGGGANLVVDCACFTARQARSLAPYLAAVDSVVMISSKAVYVDGDGRHSNSDRSPAFDGPVREEQPTLGPSDAPFDTREGYGANKAAAEAAYLETSLPVTILRPSKIHGPWSRRPREWALVRRVLDGRRPLILAQHGQGIDHPSAAANVAALVALAADRPGQRVLNAADPDAPSALEIARVVARHMAFAFEEILIDEAGPGGVGRSPWNARPPIVLDMGRALSLGYRPVGDYAQTVRAELDWLLAMTRGRAPDWALPGKEDPFFAPLLDYAAEERWRSERAGRG